MYFFGLFMFARRIPVELSRLNYGVAKRLIPHIVPFLDFTWIWLTGMTFAAFSGFAVWIQDMIHDAPNLLFNSIFFYAFNCLIMILNYCFCSTFSNEQQKQNLFGIFVNSKINFLFDKIKKVFVSNGK